MVETLIATDDNMPYILMMLDGAPEIGIDTETTGLNTRNKVDYLTAICVDTDNVNAYIPFRHMEANVSKRWIDPLVKILEEKDLDWHNMKFDYHSFVTLGINPLKFRGTQYDTLLISTLINEELYSKQLDALAKKYLNDEKRDSDAIHQLGKIYGWGKIPVEVIAPYGGHDARLTRRLKQKLWPLLVAQGLQSVYLDTELPFSKLLFKMEQRGVGTNQDYASSMGQRGRARMDTIRRKIHFNPASTTDLGNYLLTELNLPVLAYTPKGKPSFNKVAMEGYDELLQASNNPTAKLVAEYRGWQKAVTSLYEPLLEKVGPDGRIRTQFNQHIAVTGRLSASDPNLQQVPRGSSKPWNGHAKSCFTSGLPDKTLIGWDYSQVELRLAAAYGNEQILLTEFKQDGADPFKVLTPLIFGSYTEELRHDTKTFVYANLYGAGLPKIAAQLGRSVVETKPLFENYRQSISGITSVSNQVTQLMQMQGYVKYWDGRRRHIRDKREAYKAWNSVIQGGGAQLMKNAMLRCEKFEDADCKIVLSVHDEITFIITTEAIPDYEPKIIKAMTDWPEFGVRFAVEGKIWE